jgi:hypothetical protein
MAQQPRRQPSSYSPVWEPEISSVEVRCFELHRCNVIFLYHDNVIKSLPILLITNCEFWKQKSHRLDVGVNIRVVSVQKFLHIWSRVHRSIVMMKKPISTISRNLLQCISYLSLSRRNVDLGLSLWDELVMHSSVSVRKQCRQHSVSSA